MAKEPTTATGSKEIPPNLPVAGVVTPMFRLVFFTVLGQTVLSLAASFGLAIWADPTKDATKSLLETCSTTWKMGFSAIIELIGGKAL
jgi:hypothetical protein